MADMELMTLAGDGLRDRWYLIARSADIGTEPVGMRRLGLNLVVWRDGAGTIHVQEDRCPHRGAALSQGVVDGDAVVCPYHGLHIDGRGCVAAVPAYPAAVMVGEQAVWTFAAHELNMGIWAWFGRDSDTPKVPLGFPEELIDGAWGGYLWTGTWQCNWLLALDNLADPMHGSYLHANTYTLGRGTKSDRMRVEKCADGFIVERESQQGQDFDRSEFHDTGYLWFRIDIPYPRSAGPGGPLRVIGTVTPVDHDSAEIYFAHMRNSTGWQHDAWRLIYRTALYPRHMKVLAQDKRVLERMPKDAWARENLYQHDIGVARLRHWLELEVKKQLAKTAEHKMAGD